MNQRFEPSDKKPESIRSDINTTRRKMDDTIDALASRLKGRHLVDEVLEYFRTHRGNGSGEQIKAKVSEAAGNAVHSVVDAVKQHPLPALLIGAGVAWMIYENKRPPHRRRRDEDEYFEYGSGEAFDAPLDYSSASGIEAEIAHSNPAPSSPYIEPGAENFPEGRGRRESTSDRMRQRAEQMKQRMRDKAGAAGERVRHSASAMRERAHEVREQFQARTRQTYDRGRQRVVQTADQHPLEMGLACLALGLIAGLSVPASQKVSEIVAPTADRWKQRAREMGREVAEKGKHVVQAAAGAAREEAEAQGLTPEALREKAGSVAGRAREAAQETARDERILLEQADRESRPAGETAPKSPPPASPPVF